MDLELLEEIKSWKNNVEEGKTLELILGLDIGGTNSRVGFGVINGLKSFKVSKIVSITAKAVSSIVDFLKALFGALDGALGMSSWRLRSVTMAGAGPVDRERNCITMTNWPDGDRLLSNDSLCAVFPRR